jgi:hypothetical protein
VEHRSPEVFYPRLKSRGGNREAEEKSRGDGLQVHAPLVLLADLLLLLGGEVVLDVEGLPDVLGRLALDHVGHGLAGKIEEGLDVEVVSGEDELEEGGLVDLAELLVPRDDVVGPLLVLLLIRRRVRVGVVVLGPLDNLPSRSTTISPTTTFEVEKS